jgi:ribosomal protein L11 methyltransferase
MALGEAEARRVAERLAEAFETTEVAVAACAGEGGWIVEAHFAQAPDQKIITEIVRHAMGRDTALEIAFEQVAPKDWVAASLEGLEPVRVGRFVVHGAHDRHKIAPNRIGIEIEAALAFGTGYHGSTRGCLAAIERVARGRRPARILDIGTGSGVLAIAVARALRCPAVAGDLDPVAVVAARANAQANRAGAMLRIVRADGVKHPAIRAGAPYDLVLANILLSPLQLLARPLRALLAPRAMVVLSGLMPAQANAALANWRAQGLVLRRREMIENWTTLTLTRP